jgi:hypothetical protein
MDLADAVDQGDNDVQRLKPNTSPWIPNLRQETGVHVQSLQQPRGRCGLPCTLLVSTILDKFRSGSSDEVNLAALYDDREGSPHSIPMAQRLRQSSTTFPCCSKTPHVHRGCLRLQYCASALQGNLEKGIVSTRFGCVYR